MSKVSKNERNSLWKVKNKANASSKRQLLIGNDPMGGLQSMKSTPMMVLENTDREDIRSAAYIVENQHYLHLNNKPERSVSY